MHAALVSALLLVSRASPIPFRSADRFQYRHAEEGSGDLGPLYVNSWNAIIEQVTRKARNLRFPLATAR